jgi:hypothetical protein
MIPNEGERFARERLEREREERNHEIEQVRELLARTVRFLARCAEDPQATLGGEDPQDLIRGLEGLAVAPEPPVERELEHRPPTPIHLRRRRSA